LDVLRDLRAREEPNANEVGGPLRSVDSSVVLVETSAIRSVAGVDHAAAIAVDNSAVSCKQSAGLVLTGDAAIGPCVQSRLVIHISVDAFDDIAIGSQSRSNSRRVLGIHLSSVGPVDGTGEGPECSYMLSVEYQTLRCHRAYARRHRYCQAYVGCLRTICQYCREMLGHSDWPPMIKLSLYSFLVLILTLCLPVPLALSLLV
jgi:hypothetical protein